MSPKRNAYRLVSAAAVLGALAVASGAFGAHALKARLNAAGMADVWETAVFYHLIHALAALAAGAATTALPANLAGAAARAGWCWLAGVLLFSGSLYALALGGPGFLGPITPVGGLLLIIGWVLPAWSAWRQGRPRA